MNTFDHILNWKLLSGSHEFPGPEGGTCVNEAAIVAAGFPYRQVREVEDCPPCFSRPIAAYALALNDVLGFESRQLLLPYVTRLAGTADAPGVELDRVRLIAFGVTKRILPIAYRFSHLPRYAEFLDRVTDPKLAFYILRHHREEWRGGFSSKPHVGLVMAVEALIASIENLKPIEAAHLAAHAVHHLIHSMSGGRRDCEAIFAERAIEALDMALAIGRAPEIEAVDRIRAQARLDMARLEAAHQ